MNGCIVITKTSSRHRDDYVSVQISDRETMKRVIRVEVSLEDFANALFGVMATPCEVTRDTWIEPMEKV